ncbi:aldo/keto reductase [Saccharibacillus sp. CPCC 101409]|uniref:aldo/keto reductase n=1 Tax=Saccharibacillus sp. CPCC 101409 TaxID=3058041 RepID=UPI0026723B11|nr:aldo/keto reductase [Saccharibacillus sp. CPCC 101409]MDO3410301.1 aldo/keto reductase [Saccharibacillus sp. CPCC 101409]
MQLRKLARTGVDVGIYSLGGAAFGTTAERGDAQRIVHEALDAGINLIDTSDRYADGESERIIGEAIRGRRADVLIATKVGATPGGPPNRMGASRLWIKQAVERSLRRLDTDYIDLYQLHHPFPDTEFEETMDVLSDLVREGKVRYIGTSNHQAWQLVEARAVSERRRLQRFVSEQTLYSLLNREIEQDLAEAARRYEFGLLIYGPLSGGLLTGKYKAGQPADPRSRAARFGDSPLGRSFDPNLPENRRKFEIIAQLQSLAEQAGMTLPHLAAAFIRAHPAVTSVIVGPRTPRQLQDYLAGAQIRLGADLLDAIDDIVSPGSTINDAAPGWTPEWLSDPRLRRRND